MEVMQHSCWKREHTYAHFNYRFPGGLTEQELLSTATEFFKQTDKVLEQAMGFTESLPLDQRNSIILDIQNAASDYYFRWDVPFARRKTEDVVYKIKSLLTKEEIL